MVNNTSVQRSSDVMLACQYLANSTNVIIRAMTEYNNPGYGNVERSFSGIHKAWDALWKADVQSRKNGFLTRELEMINWTNFINGRGGALEYRFEKEDRLIIGITDFIKLGNNNQIGKKKNYGFCVHKSNNERIPIEIDINNRKFMKLQDIRPEIKKNDKNAEAILIEKNYSPENTYYEIDEFGNSNIKMQIGPQGYTTEKASEVFKKIANKNSPIRYNLELFRQLRNIEEHDFVELANGSHASIVLIMNPYVISNIINYLNGYIEIYNTVVKDCKENHINRDRTNYCARKQLKSIEYLRDSIVLPRSFKEIINISELQNETLFDSHMLNKDTKRKTIRKLLVEEIDKVTADISSLETKKSLFFKYEEKTLISKVSNSFIINSDDYIYKNLTEVSLAFKREGVEISKYKIQNILEKIRIENAELPMDRYVKTFWGKYTRYSKAFKNKVANYIE